MPQPPNTPKPFPLSGLPGGPAPGTILCRLDELADNTAKKIEYRVADGDREKFYPVFVIRRGDRLYGWRNRCPHARLPLDVIDGRFLDLEKKYLFCANHGAFFRMEDGFCVQGPCVGKYLIPLDVEQKDGALIVR